jgi:tetratricopeptide (TPR) repeat protein
MAARFKYLLPVCLLPFFAAAAFAQLGGYAYNYDYWDEPVISPAPYRVSAYILGSQFGIGNFRDPQGLFIRENRIYICDSGNNRVVILSVTDSGEYNLEAVYTSVIIDGNPSPFNYPMGIFETPAGEILICDTNNQRVLLLDRNWNYIFSIVKPDDQSFDPWAEFLPERVIADSAGRIFVQARNINRGIMEFDREGSFLGYLGANRVTINIIDYVWKMIATQEQRAAMDLFVPAEYNSIAIDHEGFIFVTSGSGQTEAVRRLNAMGHDILIRNGYTEPLGDLAVGTAGNITGPSRFIDVAPLVNGSYACFDRTRGRIFMYDFQGNLLYAFGGIGNREGNFLLPTALDSMGYSLFALDSRAAALTRFDLTEYGTLINNALDEYRAGRYESSAEIWEQVLKFNGNFEMARIGIGRAALRQGDFQKAMQYFRISRFRSGYSRAFFLYRKQWMEENLLRILVILGVVILVPPLVRGVKKIRKEILES